MKIQTQNDVINIEDINEDYLVVAVILGAPRILSKGWEEGNSQFSFFNLKDNFTLGNGIPYPGEGNTIQKMIEMAIQEPNSKIEAFHQRNWKEALQWLIDNAE
jgi:hypothetical protein